VVAVFRKPVTGAVARFVPPKTTPQPLLEKEGSRTGASCRANRENGASGGDASPESHILESWHLSSECPRLTRFP